MENKETEELYSLVILIRTTRPIFVMVKTCFRNVLYIHKVR